MSSILVIQVLRGKRWSGNCQLKRGWRSSSPRLEETHADKLYIVQFPDEKQDLQVALLLSGEPASDTTMPSGSRNCTWFARTSKGFKWPSFTTFKLYGATNDVSIESILLEVDVSKDLTEEGTKRWRERPVLSSDFMRKLRLFANREGLLKQPQIPDNPIHPAAEGPGGRAADNNR